MCESYERVQCAMFLWRYAPIAPVRGLELERSLIDVETLLETFPELASSLYPTMIRLSIEFSVRSVDAIIVVYHR